MILDGVGTWEVALNRMFLGCLFCFDGNVNVTFLIMVVIVIEH